MVNSGEPTLADTAISVIATAMDAMLWLMDRSASVRKTSRSALCRRCSLSDRKCSSMLSAAPASLMDCTPPNSSPTYPVTASVALRISLLRLRISGTNAWVSASVNSSGTSSTTVNPVSMEAITPSDPSPKMTKPPLST